jgi:hypothetical protein
MSAEPPDPTDDAERRLADRRGDERREFRRASGRRDDLILERRGRGPFRRRWAILVGLVFVAVLGWRSVVVGPSRAAEAEAEQALVLVQDLLGRVRLPLLAAPSFGAPVAGDPSADLASVLSAEGRAELERIDARLAPALEAAPRVAGVPEALAPVWFALGRERDARLAWEALLRHGDEDQVGRARLGLATLAIRAGLRAREEQDAGFAFDVAEAHLLQIDAGHSDARAAAFDLGLIEALRRVDASEPLALARLEERGDTDLASLLRADSTASIPWRWTQPADTLTIEEP